ncbi:uncharacterized protein KNAG_0J00630 [Huiozyma naganishii CBS 8797]|uniref:Uncharacterized protein n=1 Tax=Huiozyma naganishii (strain ATCC MYA-139 / BCRC 22969 / CBS 8797 / KCTC 17520 / NBRC 10181 / NCYC 3082 / Yp74L-3) TaxID=1071383 RepID=J7SAG5_HUIN7|nr:hypothetical protein KNAG_0J00630 [Kazachstania naganishii CBS 8797]CCK72146.1 hypothetical protein KNAG_0J00630 [Kazachstania naganishii CBS 8797]
MPMDLGLKITKFPEEASFIYNIQLSPRKNRSLSAVSSGKDERISSNIEGINSGWEFLTRCFIVRLLYLLVFGTKNEFLPLTCSVMALSNPLNRRLYLFSAPLNLVSFSPINWYSGDQFQDISELCTFSYIVISDWFESFNPRKSKTVVRFFLSPFNPIFKPMNYALLTLLQFFHKDTKLMVERPSSEVHLFLLLAFRWKWLTVKSVATRVVRVVQVPYKYAYHVNDVFNKQIDRYDIVNIRVAAQIIYDSLHVLVLELLFYITYMTQR